MECERPRATKSRYPPLKPGFVSGLVLALFLLVSCSKSGSTPVVTSFSTTNQTNTSFNYQIFSLDSTSHESSYVGTLQWNGSTPEWPSSMSGYLATIMSGTTQVQYFVTAYAQGTSGGNGDFYYEAPVTGNTLVMNGPSTALWYAMRISAASASEAINLSPTSWENILFELNAACPDCLQKSGSASFETIQSSGALQTAINEVLSSVNSPTLDAGQIADPPVGIAYGSPTLLNGTMTAAAAQDQSVNLQAVFFDPLDLAQELVPTSWEIQIPGVSGETPVTASSDPTQASWTFDTTHQGTETITANTSARGGSYAATFNFQVSYTTFAPVVDAPTLQFQANHLSSDDLSPYATDPRGEALSFALISGPVGATMSGSILSWNPTQEPISQIGQSYAEVAVTNTDGAVTPAEIQLNVIADNYPTFGTVPTTWALSEGTTGNLSFTASDTDGDPIQIYCVSGCQFLTGGFPTGAGWPNLAYPNASIYTTESSTTEDISIPYMPSYLQTIGANSVVPIILAVNYPGSDADLRQVYTPNEETVRLEITNIADPPVWQTQPQSSPGTNPTKMIAMTPMTGGDAQIPTINPPADGTLGYSLSNVNGTPGVPSNCDWITVNPATGALSGASATITGTPGYNSPATCTFTVRATDAYGLYTDSNIVTIPVTEVPRPVTAQGTIPDQTATEGQVFSLNLSPYFNDPNESAGDPVETLTYTCVNCVALGIPVGGANGVSFSGSVMTWTPAYSVAPTDGSTPFSGIEIQVVNDGGYTADQTFNLTVDDATAPMNVIFTNGSETVSGSSSPFTASMNAAATGTVTVQVANQSGDSSAYDYHLTTSCSPGCSAGISSLSTSTGVAPGTTSFTMTLSPSYADGYGGAYAPAATRQIIVNVIDSSNPSISSSAALNLTVNTEDRALSDIIMNGDNGTGTFDLTINGSLFSSNIVNFGTQGPDSSNDAFTYSFGSGSFGSLSSSSWSFNPTAAGCQSGDETEVETFAIKSTSSHGSTITRNVSVTIDNTTIGGGGGCPY